MLFFSDWSNLFHLIISQTIYKTSLNLTITAVAEKVIIGSNNATHDAKFNLDSSSSSKFLMAPTRELSDLKEKKKYCQVAKTSLRQTLPHLSD